MSAAYHLMEIKSLHQEEEGMIITNSEEYANKARYLSTQANDDSIKLYP